MKLIFKILPWFFLALFGMEIAVVMLPKPAGEWHTGEFGRLPVLLGGRIQPLDSVARNTLLQIRSTGDVPLEEIPSWQFWHHPKKLKSTDWLLEVCFKPELADTRPIFLIHHPELISELKLEDKGISKSGLRYYTYNELQPVMDEIDRQGRKANEVEDAARTTYQKQVLKLANAVFLYERLKSTLQPEGASNFLQTIQQYESLLPTALAAFRAGATNDDASLKQLSPLVQKFDALASFSYALVVPPTGGDQNSQNWSTIGTSLLGSIRDAQVSPPVNFFATMGEAYQIGNAEAFNKTVAEYTAWLQPKFPKETQKGRAEFYFNQIKLFLHGTIIYVFVFVLASGALLTFGSLPTVSESLRRSSFYLLALAFVVHTFALIYRMALEGRPPVTNLYSSAIFIGWGACLLGLILERIYKVGIGCVVGGLAGFVTLLIAHNLAIGGDTMEMLRAVLDTNFWLATHVVVVTLGYASTFVAGLLAIVYIMVGIFTVLLSHRLGDRSAAAPGVVAGAVAAKTLSPHMGKMTIGQALSKMIYAVVCFATLFSFTGTVLGGIWADQSWGRFWGWDPKENGALLIVVWNAIILHARWGGLVRERGIANLAVFGNIVTSFSWFGVNMLGIGLHSYGFMDAAFKWLMLFIGSQLLVIALGLLPLRLWRSFAEQNSRPGADGVRPPQAHKQKPAPAV